MPRGRDERADRYGRSKRKVSADRSDEAAEWDSDRRGARTQDGRRDRNSRRESENEIPHELALSRYARRSARSGTDGEDERRDDSRRRHRRRSRSGSDSDAERRQPYRRHESRADYRRNNSGGKDSAVRGGGSYERRYDRKDSSSSTMYQPSGSAMSRFETIAPQEMEMEMDSAEMMYPPALPLPGPGMPPPLLPPPHFWGALPSMPYVPHIPPPPPPIDPNDPTSVAMANAIRSARIMELVSTNQFHTGELARLLEEQKAAAEAQERMGSSDEFQNTFVADEKRRELPSVEDFVPTIPKSMLAELKMSGGTGGRGDPCEPAAQPTEVLEQALVFSAPKIAPEVERRAREARRAHVSGFPIQTTQEHLLDYFRLLLPKIRREKTVREMHELAEELHIPQDERQALPSSAQTNNVDIIRDLTISNAKSKKFAFIEVNLADMISELVEMSEQNKHDLLFTDPTDPERQYPLSIRRPRDYEVLNGVDDTKVVMTGFPATFSMERLRDFVQSFGEVVKFEAKEELAYAEFSSREEALHCREGMHGLILGSRMIVAFPLHDWLKVLCSQTGIDVTIADDDPISGRAVFETVAAEARQAKIEQNQAAAEGVLALIKETPSSARELMHALLSMTSNLHEIVMRLAAIHPHLRPLYGNTQVVIYPTRVLALLNMFDEEELVLDTTFSALQEAIEKQVESYGRVEQLIIPRRRAPPTAPVVPVRGSFVTPEEEKEALEEYEEAKKLFQLEMEVYYQDTADPVKGGYGNVYVVYHTVEEAELAQQKLAGKLFSGRTVVTCFLFEDMVLNEAEADTNHGDSNIKRDSVKDEEHHVAEADAID